MPNLNNLFIYIRLIKPYIGRLVATRRRLGVRGQAWLEYAVILTLVVTAISAMQVYVRRGLQGRYKDATDYALDTIGTDRQYEPYYLESDITTESSEEAARTYAPGGSSSRTISEEKMATGVRRILPYSDGAGD